MSINSSNKSFCHALAFLVSIKIDNIYMCIDYIVESELFLFIEFTHERNDLCQCNTDGWGLGRSSS